MPSSYSEKHTLSFSKTNYFYFIEKVAHHELRKQSTHILNFIFNEVSSSRVLPEDRKILKYSLQHIKNNNEINDCFYENVLRSIQTLVIRNTNSNKVFLNPLISNTGVFKNENIYEFYNVRPDFYLNSILMRMNNDVFFKRFHYNFGIMINSITNNRFLTSLYKEKLTNLLLKALRLYKFFNYRINKIETSKMRVYNTHDLYMNDFNDVPNKNKLYLKQNGAIYLFNIFEILKYIQKQLLYQEYFISVPRLINNPYTNLPFNIYHLYKIYLTCLERCIHVPLAFAIYLKHGFERLKLINEHTMFFHSEGIKQTYKEMSNDEKEFYMHEMLTESYFKNILKYPLFLKFFTTPAKRVAFLEKETRMYITYIYNISNLSYSDELYKKLREKLTIKNQTLETMESKSKTKRNIAKHPHYQVLPTGRVVPFRFNFNPVIHT